jgi:hypothetical protein
MSFRRNDSHVTTEGPSVSPSWRRVLPETDNEILCRFMIFMFLVLLEGHAGGCDKRT